jgi:hypothetical protein
MMLTSMLISGGSTPRLASSICLNPLEKHRLVPDSFMAVHRVKNCCGKIIEMYDFQIYFVIQNCNQNEKYSADENTSLTQILSHPDIMSHVRLTDSLEKFKAKNDMNLQESCIAKQFTVLQLAHNERNENQEKQENDNDDDHLEEGKIREIYNLDDSIFEHDHVHDDEQSLCCCVRGDSGNGQWMLMHPFSSPSFYRPFNTNSIANPAATAVDGGTDHNTTTDNDDKDDTDETNAANVPSVAIDNESEPVQTSYQKIFVSSKFLQ